MSGVSICAIVVLATTLLWNLQQVSHARAEAAQANAVIGDLRGLGEDLLDAESSQRGYLLTQDDHDLERFRSGVDKAEGRVRHLRDLVSGSTVSDDLARMVPVISGKLEELATSVTLTRNGQRDAAMRIVSGGPGRRLTDEFRVMRSDAIASESRQLEERRERVRESSSNAVVILIAGSIVTVFVLLVSTHRVTRKLLGAVSVLVNSIETVTSGSLEHEIPTTTRSEMDRIAKALNAMTKRLVEIREARNRARLKLERSLEKLRRSEEAARKAQSFLARTGAIAGVGGWEISLDDDVLTWSDETCRLLGVDAGYRPSIDERMGFYAPAGRPLIERAMQDSLESGRPWDLELELMTAAGRFFWARVTGTAEAENGKVVRLVGALQDITDRVQAQRQLKEKSANLEATLEAMQQGLLKVAADRRIELSNRRFAEMLDLPAHLLDKASPHFDEVLAHIDERGEFAAADDDLRRRVRDRGKPLVVGVHERVRPNGQVLEVVTSPVGDGSFVSTYSDVTARRQAEKALRESEALYRMLADATSDVITQLDLDLVRRYASPACRAMLGYEPEEMTGVKPPSMIHPDDVAEVRGVMERLAAGRVPGDRATTTNRMRHKDGHWVWLEAVINLGRDPDTGAPQSLICVLRDVTERQRAARHIERARAIAENAARIKSDFVANMSHELRTPLTGILAIHELLQDDSTLGPRQRHYLALAHDAGQSLLAIVNDVLDFSKIEAGQLSIDAVPFDPRQVIEFCRAFGTSLIKQKPVLVTARFEGTDVALRGDPNRLRQVLLNLVTNAVKFTEQGRIVIEARYRPDRNRLRVEVADTGIGIAEDQLRSLFGRFNQADTSITRRYGGTGLGLAICKRLVALMDGEIGVLSRPGQGSTFWFEVPLAVVEAGETVPSMVRGIDPALPRRVLLAEDNPINQEIIAAMLEARGHEVTIVGDGVAAVASAQAGGFDLLLLDMQMPLMDGLSAARAIRVAEAASTREPIAIIGLTANALTEDVAQCLAAGMDAHVAKPIDLTLLLDTMAAVVAAAPGGHRMPGSASPVLDEAKLEELAGFIGIDRLLVLIDKFAVDIERRLTEVASSTEAELATSMHSLISLSGQLGFTELSHLCVEIEAEARRGAGLVLIDELRRVAARAREAAETSLFARSTS